VGDLDFNGILNAQIRMTMIYFSLTWLFQSSVKSVAWITQSKN